MIVSYNKRTRMISVNVVDVAFISKLKFSVTAILKIYGGEELKVFIRGKQVRKTNLHLCS
jgi:hypothetical protein